MALSVQRSLMLDLRENERDLKNRKRFGWTDDDTAADWPHAAGAYRRIESANKGRGDERHARLGRSESGRLGRHSLSGTCQTEGISLVHCSRYIHNWITKERFRIQ